MTRIATPQATGEERAATVEAFLEALSRRDFVALERVLGPTMRMRALLAKGFVEHHGAADVRQSFADLFGDLEEFEVLAADRYALADREHLRWRLRVRWPGESIQRVIEEHAFAKVVEGRIVSLDLVCSGFRPLEDGVAG